MLHALNQGLTAGANAGGGTERYTRLPYFFSDQYDLGLEYSGHADPATDELVVHGDLASREFVAYWSRDGSVTAGMNVNVWDVTEPLQALIRTGRPVDPERLADPGTPLESCGV